MNHTAFIHVQVLNKTCSFVVLNYKCSLTLLFLHKQNCSDEQKSR